MNEIVIKPRKKQLVFATGLMVIMGGIFAMIFFASKTGAARTISGIMMAICAGLWVGVFTGSVRAKVVMSDSGLKIITSAFAKEKEYTWKDVHHVLWSDDNYAMYDRQEKWIGSFDVRSEGGKEALRMIHKKKVPVVKE